MMKIIHSFISIPSKLAQLTFILAAHLIVFLCTLLELGAKRPSLGAATPGANIQIEELRQRYIEPAA